MSPKFKHSLDNRRPQHTHLHTHTPAHQKTPKNLNENLTHRYCHLLSRRDTAPNQLSVFMRFSVSWDKANLSVEGTKTTLFVIYCSHLQNCLKLIFAICPSWKHTDTPRILPGFTLIFQIATIWSNYITRRAFPLIFLLVDNSRKFCQVQYFLNYNLMKIDRS